MSVKLYLENGRRRAEVELKSSDLIAENVEKIEELKYPFGCRSGSCGVCRAHVLEGKELLKPPGPVEEDTIERCEEVGVRLVCKIAFEDNAAGNLRVKSIK